MFAFVLLAAVSARGAEKVVFDTDMGNDCDDVLAQVMLLSYAQQARAEILCIATNKDNALSPKFVRLICEYYGLGDIPVYAVRNGASPLDGHFLRQTFDRKTPDGKPAHTLKNGSESFADSVSGLRKTLAAQPDNSVVYISVGFFSNLARLIESKPDAVSPLSGRELVAKKVKYISAMAGGFTPAAFWGRTTDRVYPEYNVIVDLPASKTVLENPPCPVVLSPFELCINLRFPYYSVLHDFKNPSENPASFACDTYVRRIFNASKNTLELDRYMWDLTSVLFVFEPQLFGVSAAGEVEVARNGVTTFIPSKDGKSGKIRYLTMKPQQERKIVSKCVELVRSAR